MYKDPVSHDNVFNLGINVPLGIICVEEVRFVDSFNLGQNVSAL